MKKLPVSLLVITGLLAAGCSDSNSSNGSMPAPAGSTTTQATSPATPQPASQYPEVQIGSQT